MGPEHISYAIFIDFFKKNENSLINFNKSYLNNYVEQLVSFCFSESFIPFLYFELEAVQENTKKNYYPFSLSLFIALYEDKEKFLSLKIFLYLLEELKKKKFDEKLKELFKKIKDYEFKNNVKNNAKRFLESMDRNSNITRQILELALKNGKYIESLYNLNLIIFILTFKDIIDEFIEKKIREQYFTPHISPDNLEEGLIPNLLNYLLQINSLNETKNAYNFLIFYLNLYLREKQNIFNNDLYISEFFNELESSIKNNNFNFNKQYIKQLIPLFSLELLFLNNDKPIKKLFEKYESKEKYLSLKIFFYLLEILKKDDFNIQIKEITNFIFAKKSNNLTDFENAFNLFLKIFKGFPKQHKILSSNEKQFKKPNEIDSKYIKIISRSCINSFILSFKDILFPIIYDSNEFKFDKLLKMIWPSHIKNEDRNEIQLLINHLVESKKLIHNENEKQLIIFSLNFELNRSTISFREKINDDFFEEYNKGAFIDELLIWQFYNEQTGGNKPDKQYIKTTLKGKFTEKEKIKYDFFENIKEVKFSQNIDGIKGSINQSLFNKNKTIFMLKIDLEYFKKNTINFGQLKNELKLIKNNNSNNIDIYAQIENKIINLDNSFDLFIKELKEKKINIQDNNNLNKICQEEKINNNIELDKLKLELTKEIKKNKALEEELTTEKINNKKNVTLISELRKNLDNEIKKYNDLKKEIEEDKIERQKLDKEAKEDFIEKIIEKDKEIKDLKLKLSRLPFTIEEGEELMSIIFISTNQKLQTSIICKNTDEFHKVEAQLYNNYPEYSENDNIFLLSGKKINRFKTLEQNGIKNNAVIIMNEKE